MIKVVRQDDRGGRNTVLEVALNPSEYKQIPVITEGAATIEVYHKNRLVFREPMAAPPRTDEADQGQEEPMDTNADQGEPPE